MRRFCSHSDLINGYRSSSIAVHSWCDTALRRVTLHTHAPLPHCPDPLVKCGLSIRSAYRLVTSSGDPSPYLLDALRQVTCPAAILHCHLAAPPLYQPCGTDTLPASRIAVLQPSCPVALRLSHIAVYLPCNPDAGPCSPHYRAAH